MIPPWLAHAVVYQVYVQSFADGNEDGIGDLAGLAERLDYLAWLGVDLVWLTPVFRSPMRDAGYDVADYCAVDPRYGINEELERMVRAARAGGMRVVLDLVAGHTSDEHPWFAASCANLSDGRYIWADRPAKGFVPGPGGRRWYLPNFYPFQPALNFGYARMDPAEPWRQPTTAPGPAQNRQAIRDIMSFWLDRGVSGFRVDMAFSLVKDDPGWTETATLWRGIRQWLDQHYPDTVLLAEWGEPDAAIAAGFHADFFLHMTGTAMRSLWDTGEVGDEAWEPVKCYFHPDGAGTPKTFIDAYEKVTKAIGTNGFAVLPTSNHDFARLASGPRTVDQLGAAFAFLLTWPTIPAIFQGDEIGMRHISGLAGTEGSRISDFANRTGARTPMQWDTSVNAGFSTAAPEMLYLPFDPDPHRPDIASQQADPHSLPHTVRQLISLRREVPDLSAGTPVQVLHAGYPLVYRRGPYLVAVNPGRNAATAGASGRGQLLAGRDCTRSGDVLDVGGFGWGIYREER